MSGHLSHHCVIGADPRVDRLSAVRIVRDGGLHQASTKLEVLGSRPDIPILVKEHLDDFPDLGTAGHSRSATRRAVAKDNTGVGRCKLAYGRPSRIVSRTQQRSRLNRVLPKKGQSPLVELVDLLVDGGVRATLEDHDFR